MDNNNTMEYRIGLEKQNKRNDQVVELILDNCRASQISGLTEDFVNLETLSLINVGLTTLKGFPKLPKLKKLELSDNRLTGGLNLLHGSPNLQHLNISGNRIKDFEALEPLKEFHDLVSLDLYNCEVTKDEGYRKKVFEFLPNLKALDGFDAEDNEVADSDEDDDEGSDVENHITREDNESEEGAEAVGEEEDDDEDDDDDEDEDDDRDQDLEGSYDESFDESEDGITAEDKAGMAEVYGVEGEDLDDEDDDDDDEDEDDEDDDDDDGEDDDEIIGAENSSSAAIGSSGQQQQHNSVSNNNSATGAHNDAQDEDVQEIHDIDDDDDDDDMGEDDDEDDDDEEDDDEDDLRLLQKESFVEDEDDADFEPGQEPDERDHEIDPEDDADEDVPAAVGGDTSAQLSTSKQMDTTTTTTTETSEADAVGKRKLDEAEVDAGDEKRAKRKVDEGEPADTANNSNQE